MNKKLQSLATRTSFSDFTGKLAAKWRLQTASLPDDQLDSTGSSQHRLEDILAKLVAAPTVTGSTEVNHDTLNLIEEFLKERGMNVKRYEWNGVESLVATAYRTKRPHLLLAAHLDVVPGTEEMFTLQEVDGKFFGRGVLDMKFAIASYLCIVDELGNDLKKYDFGIAITTDEEAGGSDGVAKLIEEGYLPKACVLPDGGDDWQIQLYSKGFLYLSVSVKGQPAHGSRPWLGDNAIITLAEVVGEIKKLFPEHNEETNTLNIGKIHGGEAINQVAEYAEALIDIRVISEKEKARLLKAIAKVCKKYEAELNVVIDGPTSNFDIKNPYIATFAQRITEVVGVEVKGSRTLGSNDARYYAKYNIPCISIYPTGGGHHGPGEWISKKAFHQFHEVLRGYVQQDVFKRH